MTRFAGVLFRSTLAFLKIALAPFKVLHTHWQSCRLLARGGLRDFRPLTSFFTCRIDPGGSLGCGVEACTASRVPLCPRTSCAGPRHGARTTRALLQCGQRFRTHRSHMYCMHTCRPHMHSQAAAHDSYCPATADACVCVMETAVRIGCPAAGRGNPWMADANGRTPDGSAR